MITSTFTFQNFFEETSQVKLAKMHLKATFRFSSPPLTGRRYDVTCGIRDSNGNLLVQRTNSSETFKGLVLTDSNDLKIEEGMTSFGINEAATKYSVRIARTNTWFCFVCWLIVRPPELEADYDKQGWIPHVFLML